MRKISIGAQGFEKLRTRNCFYVDKTDFIREWWDSEDDVTLITRPRRFGKTLNMDTLNCFFSNRYADRPDLFEGLNIWKYEEYRKLQGTYPVIFLSFADVKARDYANARESIIMNIQAVFEEFLYAWKKDKRMEKEDLPFMNLDAGSSDAQVCKGLQKLCAYLYRYYGKKTIILLDEYDTPLQEAYVGGYWEKMVEFIRSLFNATFKTNPYLERAVMTGITRVSKESIFSDLNNLEVVTTTAQKYNSVFGFTKEEVFQALDEFDLSDQKENVKKWYDGFTFGDLEDVYNPWSITKFLDEKRFAPYWANTSSNSLIGLLVRHGKIEVKLTMENLLHGGFVETPLEEDVIFNQLDMKEEALWSLMMASGYLKITGITEEPETFRRTYRLTLTNLEVKIMFENLIADWFAPPEIPYNEFLRAMQKGNLREMNIYMNEILLEMVSSFDAGNRPSERLHPERFYHGLVLGLMATEHKYEVRSNGESGYGRYDITMVPKRTVRERGEILPSFVIEFKLFNPDAPDYEKSLEDTAKRALQQIEEKAYDTAILSQGIPKEQIRHYGFGFEGKKVFIGTDTNQ